MKDPIQFYNRKIPLQDEIVMIRYDEIAENCVYVTLMEYNIKGMIIFKELSKRRLRKRNLQQAAPIGKFAPAVVSEETDDNIIVLTRRRVTDDEVRSFSEVYKKNRKIISMMENLSYYFKWDINKAFELITHPLDERYIESEEYEDLYSLFENTDDLSYLDDLNIEVEVKDKLKEIICKNFIQSSEKISVKMAIVSNSLEGINVTKEILTTILNTYKDISICLEKSPYYIMEMMSNNPNNDLTKLKKIAEEIGKLIVAKQGNFKIMS